MFGTMQLVSVRARTEPWPTDLIVHTVKHYAMLWMSREGEEVKERQGCAFCGMEGGPEVREP